MNYNIVLKISKSPNNMVLGDVIELIKSLSDRGYDIRKMLDFKIEFEQEENNNNDVESVIDKIHSLNAGNNQDYVPIDNQDLLDSIKFE